ncbi:MAG: hypothetical protein LQ346_003147 [Caloplaca aetnensis]|nr:MAG: hypothetical protein LQ346_003147 [Caloplaca aetnensis]
MSNPVVDIASAIQSASIKRHPSPTHDLNPSTAASSKKPVSPATSIPSDADSIPESALRPTPRRANLPPLPDMRFEQSYLASLQGAESWWRIAWITARDQAWLALSRPMIHSFRQATLMPRSQVILPLVQGMLWTLLLSGWRYWNRGAQFQGASLGTKVRKWWWKVNDWKIPEQTQVAVEEKAEEVRHELFKRWNTPPNVLDILTLRAVLRGADGCL